MAILKTCIPSVVVIAVVMTVVQVGPMHVGVRIRSMLMLVDVIWGRHIILMPVTVVAPVVRMKVLMGRGDVAVWMGMFFTEEYCQGYPHQHGG